MDTLQKIAYGVGISIAVSTFILFLFSFIPHMINNNDWERAEIKMIDAEFMKNEIEAHQAFIAFNERYPDALGQFDKHNRGGGSYEVAIANFTSNNSLTLLMDYNANSGKINVNVRCDKFDSDIKDSSVHGVLSVQFIKENTCMEKGLTEPAIEVGVISYAEPFVILD